MFLSKTAVKMSSRANYTLKLFQPNFDMPFWVSCQSFADETNYKEICRMSEVLHLVECIILVCNILKFKW